MRRRRKEFTPQDELGWINFIRGRHSKYYEEGYDLYLEELPDKKGQQYKTGRAWAIALVKASLTLLVDIWHSRNDQYHNQDDNDDGLSPRIRELHNRIRETYKDQLLFSTALRAKLFDKPMEERLQQRPFQLMKWIQTVAMTEKVNSGGGQAPIYSYFHPTRPPDNIGQTGDAH